ncbi:MAG TPA: M20 family metallopeptidase [Thermoplasmata archaeon]|jgi:amidohydrolase|nr:M20 family metallopeptidase [Thermoplasmata archaeon]
MVASRESWTALARRALPAMRAWRTAIHQEPELSGQETKTQEKIVAALTELGIPYRTYPGLTAVVGLIGEERSGPVVALRAELDGLPVTEATGLPFQSRFPGRMHACGHDVHLACLLGAASVLARQPRLAQGPVKLLFQPAEEDGDRGGALPMIERGCLERPRVDFVVGQHVLPNLPLGVIGWRVGPFMAAADAFKITVTGTGGHAATPHQGPDAILVGSEIVTGLQALVSRVRNPTDPVVVSVGSFHGGTRHNILPDSVVLEGTVRTMRPATRDLLERAFARRVRAIASSLGARVRIEYRRGYPALINPPEATRTVARALTEEFGRDHVREVEDPIMGAEDFARFLERVPGTFLRLGVGVPGQPASLHSATFAPDERALVLGAATLLAATEGLQASRG